MRPISPMIAFINNKRFTDLLAYGTYRVDITSYTGCGCLTIAVFWLGLASCAQMAFVVSDTEELGSII